MRDLARITVGGKDTNPSAREGELEYAAYLVWMAVVERAEKAQAALYEHEGIMGVVWEGYLNDVYRDLWPASKSPVSTTEDHDDGRKLVSDFLRLSGNVVCLTRGELNSKKYGNRRFGPSRWWARGKYNEVHVGEARSPAPSTAPAPAPKVKAAAAEPATASAPATAVFPASKPPGEHKPEGSANYTCREPGCGQNGFVNASVRRDHEMVAHQDLSSRKWVCHVTVSGGRMCGERFYDMPPLAVHTGRAHRVTKGTTEYDMLMSEAAREAEEAGYVKSGSAVPGPPPAPDVRPVAPPASPPPPPPPPVKTHPELATATAPPIPPPPPLPAAPSDGLSVLDRAHEALMTLGALVEENEELRVRNAKLEDELIKARKSDSFKARLKALLEEE